MSPQQHAIHNIMAKPAIIIIIKAIINKQPAMSPQQHAIHNNYNSHQYCNKQPAMSPHLRKAQSYHMQG